MKISTERPCSCACGCRIGPDVAGICLWCQGDAHEESGRLLLLAVLL